MQFYAKTRKNGKMLIGCVLIYIESHPIASRYDFKLANNWTLLDHIGFASNIDPTPSRCIQPVSNKIQPLPDPKPIASRCISNNIQPVPDIELNFIGFMLDVFGNVLDTYWEHIGSYWLVVGSVSGHMSSNPFPITSNPHQIRIQ